jgi:hypothetical protein
LRGSVGIVTGNVGIEMQRERISENEREKEIEREEEKILFGGCVIH